MSDGCAACGARAVGPPLPRPERTLPSYVCAFLVCAAGALLLFAFLAAAAAALFQRESFSLSPSSLVRAAETAAWRLKWVLLPASLAAAWAGWRACASIGREPERRTGLRLARAGLASAALAALSLVLFIAVTVPERLYWREVSRRAADEALLHGGDRALLEYRARYGTYPERAQDLKRLPDPDGSIAALVALLESGSYTPTTDLASLSRARGRGRRSSGAARTRNVGARGADTDAPGAKLFFTNYELVLPGRDRVLGTADDLRVRDGLIDRAPRPSTKSSPAATPRLRPNAP